MARGAWTLPSNSLLYRMLFIRNRRSEMIAGIKKKRTQTASHSLTGNDSRVKLCRIGDAIINAPKQIQWELTAWDWGRTKSTTLQAQTLKMIGFVMCCWVQCRMAGFLAPHPPLKLSITHSSWNYMVLWRTGPRLVGIRFGKDAFIYYASVASLAGWLDGASPLARHALIKSPLDGWFFIRPVFMSGISKPTPPRPACKLDDGNVDDDDDRQ